MAYEPDQLRLSKREIIEQFNIAERRLAKDKLHNLKFIGELKAIKALIAWTSEEKFPYYWLEIMRIFDAIRTLNELRGTPNTKQLADIQEQKVAEAIITIPGEKKGLLVDFTKSLQFGALEE